MPKKTLYLNNITELKPGDVVRIAGPHLINVAVERDVPIEPFVPDPTVWRSTGTPQGAAPIQNRQNIDVHNPESGGWTRYVRRDED